MKPGALAVVAVAAFLSPVLARAGQAAADRLAAVEFPTICGRHGWQFSPCPRCMVWESPPYTTDQERADRAEARTISNLKGAANGKQPESR